MVQGQEVATWVLTFRGRWSPKWREYIPAGARHIRLTHGRTELNK
jgi:hypothetical protein